MAVEAKIKLDGGSLVKYSDGKITLGGRGSCLTWGLLVAIGLTTLGALALMVSQLFEDVLTALELFGVSVFLGFGIWFLVNNLKRGVIVLDPSTKSIRLKKGEIPFSEVDSVSIATGDLPMMQGAVLITFHANLTSGDKIALGSVSGDYEKIASRADQIQKILERAIKG